MKQKTCISVDEHILDAARKSGVNISQIAENALCQQLTYRACSGGPCPIQARLQTLFSIPAITQYVKRFTIHTDYTVLFMKE